MQEHTVTKERDELFSKKQEVTDHMDYSGFWKVQVLGLRLNGSLTSCHVGVELFPF